MYYRIYRPYEREIQEIEPYEYLKSDDYCKNREELIRYFQILQKKIKELFKYIEPSENNIKVYSLILYELLTDVCIEVENNLRGIMEANGYKSDRFNMSEDYFKLNEVLHLDKYKVKIILKSDIQEICPFENWSSSVYSPLEWYKAYNDVKHNRSENIEKANLIHLLQAFAGLYILLYSQFYEYANCVSSSNTMFLFAEQGGLIVPNPNNIFEISGKPKWTKGEMYHLSDNKYTKFFEECKNRRCINGTRQKD